MIANRSRPYECAGGSIGRRERILTLLNYLARTGALRIRPLHPVFAFSVTTYHALNVYILLLLIVFDLTLSTRRQT